MPDYFEKSFAGLFFVIGLFCGAIVRGSIHNSAVIVNGPILQ